MISALQKFFTNKDLFDRFLTINAVAAFGLKISAQLLAFGLYVLLARYLGVENFGIYVFVWSWIQILTIATKFGMDVAATRYIGAYFAQEKWSHLKIFRSYAHRFTLSISITIAALGALIIFILPGVTGALKTTFYIGLAILPVWSLLMIDQASLRAFKKTILGLVPDFLVRNVLQIFLVGLCFLLGVQASAPLGMATALISVLSAMGLSFLFSHNVIKKTQNADTIIPEKEGAALKKEWLHYAFVMLLMSGGAVLLRHVDIVMLGILTDETQTSIYAVATRIANLVPFALVAVNFVIAPMIAGIYARGENEKLQKMLSQSAILIAGATIILTLFLWIFSLLLLGLFGPEFTLGDSPLKILLASQIVNALCGSVTYVMTMTGHQKQSTIIFGITIIVNIVLNLTLIPLYGSIGAALATGACIILWNITQLIYVIRKIGFNPSIFGLKYKYVMPPSP